VSPLKWKRCAAPKSDAPASGPLDCSKAAIRGRLLMADTVRSDDAEADFRADPPGSRAAKGAFKVPDRPGADMAIADLTAAKRTLNEQVHDRQSRRQRAVPADDTAGPSLTDRPRLNQLGQ
jgi:hypothetical protein